MLILLICMTIIQMIGCASIDARKMENEAEIRENVRLYHHRQALSSGRKYGKGVGNHRRHWLSGLGSTMLMLAGRRE